MKHLAVLGIETSGETCRVALLTVPGRPGTVSEILRQAAIIEREYSGDASRHSEMLWTLLDQVLGPDGRRPRPGTGRLAPGSIGLVAVSIGPGSFTGLRVGLAAAKVFTQFGRIPLVGVPTLEASAEDACAAGTNEALATLDARRGEVYAARFRRSGKFLRQSGRTRICTMEEARQGLPAGIPMSVEPPRAAVVAALGAARFFAGKADDPRTLVPVYVRRPEAVERRLRARRR